VSRAGLLCFVIVICAGKYLITNTLMMSESELFLLEVFFLSPCFHDKCLKFMKSLFMIPKILLIVLVIL